MAYPPRLMEIQPIVVGTAGHIDHGKSTLVRALTGIEPDRWAEEKERGMTIDLGFARFELEDGRRVGLIDVPGHERFIRNMVAGATGIDLVILVVAADDGVMPQTREHLSIMQLLGVSRGFIALTKVDVVDAEMVELAELDVREAVAGTFLEDAPLHRVSAVTGAGLDDLKATLVAMASEAEPRSADGVFRMPVQRVFSARGFGTVLTGVPVSGTARIGDVLEVLPRGGTGKVRGIQAYHEAAETARAGHSSALNLSDVDHKAVERGDVVATPGYFKPQDMVGAELRVLEDSPWPVRNRMPVRVHCGTSDAVGEVVLLDAPELEQGQSGLVQFRLETPLVCAPGDRYVVRLASPMVTLGGGVVLEESRYRLKRFKTFVIEELRRQAESLGSASSLLEAQLARAPERWAPLDELSSGIKRTREDTRELLAELAADGRAVDLGQGQRWIHAETLELSLEEVRDAVTSWFSANPLRARMDVRDVRSGVKLDPGLLKLLLEREFEAGRYRLDAGGFLAIEGREVALDEETRNLLDRVRTVHVEARFQPPSLAEAAAAVGATEDEVARVLLLLVDQGAVTRISGDLHLSAEALEEARESIVANCERNDHLEIPELRDALDTTRKFLIPVLEHFDAVGLTLRQAGRRVLKRR